MKANERIALARSKIRHYTDKQLARLNVRIWEWLEKHYGTGCWDWPTLYYTYPSLACYHAALKAEYNERRTPCE